MWAIRFAFLKQNLLHKFFHYLRVNENVNNDCMGFGVNDSHSEVNRFESVCYDENARVHYVYIMIYFDQWYVRNDKSDAMVTIILSKMACI